MPQPPDIPRRYSSLMPGRIQERLEVIQKRKTSAMSALSACSDVSDFLGQKIEELKQGVEYHSEYLQGLAEALRSGQITHDEFHPINLSTLKKRRKVTEELVAAKRQRKFIEEDLQEEGGLQGQVENLQNAYIETMTARVKSATAAQSKSHFDQDRFRKDVEKHYDAVRYQGGQKEAWCCLTGWTESSDTKAAHIVPKSLQSQELSYLFGVGEAVLSDARNGLILHKKIEEALDSGLIAIVPVSEALETPTRWKLLLTDDSKAKDHALGFSGTGFVLWKHLDGRELKFRGNRRPARRFLYFRYIMTYLICQQLGRSLEWTKKADTKGHMWPTPGPYLRESMLKMLASKVSHQFLPKELVETTTFKSHPGSPKQDDEETLGEALSLSMSVRLVNPKVKRKHARNANGNRSSSDDESA
ncbi:MAG: hypothetical protein M1816_006073 [Peltula sp. TS41687]|nr:MAG: hypothetical protein M1816_006073 [Peltula sp. TS41687]